MCLLFQKRRNTHWIHFLFIISSFKWTEKAETKNKLNEPKSKKKRKKIVSCAIHLIDILVWFKICCWISWIFLVLPASNWKVDKIHRYTYIKKNILCNAPHRAEWEKKANKVYSQHTLLTHVQYMKIVVLLRQLKSALCWKTFSCSAIYWLLLGLFFFCCCCCCK